MRPLAGDPAAFDVERIGALGLAALDDRPLLDRIEGLCEVFVTVDNRLPSQQPGERKAPCGPLRSTTLALALDTHPRMASTDASWAPMREAMPSFRKRWQTYTASRYYEPSAVGTSMSEFVRHLCARLTAGNWSEYAGVAKAIETLYAQLPAADSDFVLTIGFFEDLLTDAEAAGLDLEQLHRLLGPRAREGWRTAFRYTRRGVEWKDRSAKA